MAEKGNLLGILKKKDMFIHPASDSINNKNIYSKSLKFNTFVAGQLQSYLGCAQIFADLINSSIVNLTELGSPAYDNHADCPEKSNRVQQSCSDWSPQTHFRTEFVAFEPYPCRCTPLSNEYAHWLIFKKSRTLP